jgi:hypothetical protein
LEFPKKPALIKTSIGSVSNFYLSALPLARYYVKDPSKGEAPGVVKGGEDQEIAGKLELLKGEP